MSEQLYSHDKSIPTTLPKRITLEDGSTRTSLHEYDDLQLAKWGFVPAPSKPVQEPGKVIDWNDDVWVVRDKSQEELDAEALAVREGMQAERWQFATACLLAGIITPQEAQDWAPGNSLPAGVDAALNGAIADPGHLAVAKVKALSVTVIHRNNPLIEIMRGAFNLTEEQADNLFIAAADLE